MKSVDILKGRHPKYLTVSTYTRNNKNGETAYIGDMKFLSNFAKHSVERLYEVAQLVVVQLSTYGRNANELILAKKHTSMFYGKGINTSIDFTNQLNRLSW